MNKQLAALVAGSGIAIVLMVASWYNLKGYGSTYSLAGVVVAWITAVYQYRCFKKSLQ